MKRISPAQQEEQYPIVLVMFASLLGLIVRVIAPLQANFPLNDGGLFYVMIRDIQQNGYILPALTSYNFANLPLAYPPLAFYFTGLLSDLTRVNLLDVLRILPAIVSTLSIPAFYSLARHFSPNHLSAAIATICFALMPRGFEWLIMGGGITRSFGLLFALLTMQVAMQLFKTGQRRFILWTIVWGALLCVTHPEAVLQTALAVLIFYLFLNRSLKGLLHSGLVAIGILVLTSPWWAIVLSQHGVGPLLAAPNAAKADTLNFVTRLFLLFRFEFLDEQFLQIFSVLALFGLAIKLINKEYLLLTWLALPFLLEPRGAQLYLVIPLAILAGFALTENILPMILKFKDKLCGSESQYLLNDKTVRVILGFLIIYSVMSSYTIASTIQTDLTLKNTDLEAFQWVEKNTPTDSQFIILTGQHHLRDAVSEWFPVLAERRSQATVFGYEWQPDGRFRQRIDAYQDLQACLYQATFCLDEWSQKTDANFSYVYVWNQSDPTRFPISIYLQENPGYDLVYQNEQNLIFKKIR